MAYAYAFCPQGPDPCVPLTGMAVPGQQSPAAFGVSRDSIFEPHRTHTTPTIVIESG